jgi:glycosyltransferase involved in cell wall biosynthesis
VSAPEREATRPRLAIIGPMLGRNPGYTTTQGEILTDLFRAAGYHVVSSSAHPGRFRRLADIVRSVRRARGDVDAVIIESYSGPSFVVDDIASYLARSGGIPVIFHLHGGSLPSLAKRYPKWVARVFRRGAATVAPSAYLAREMAASAGPVRVIPNVIAGEANPFRLREQVSPKLLWMRAYHPIYNPVMAVRVLQRLRRTLPDATLVMAGQDKGMMREVADAARTLGVADAVEVAGFLDERGKRATAARSDIFINTTHVDNAPVGVVEMCAMGLPVISTDVGGVPDLLTREQTGILVADNDDAAMTDAIVRLVRDPALASRLSRNGPTVAARCAWPTVRAAWEQLFAEIL